ncbi:MAG TPA: hypothetical protein VFL88_00295 [Gemmatimonadales bacterium]|jgi:hypothetical protein|nr:hypothetical protein [Gemmatimonadales bacterium]
MRRILPIAGALCALIPALARGVPLDPFYYQWRDIAGNCLSTCNNNVYRCPCIRIVIPR